MTAPRRSVKSMYTIEEKETQLMEDVVQPRVNEFNCTF